MRQKSLTLGAKIKLLCGYNSVQDKMTKESVCSEFQLPFGFNGPMYPFGMHVDSYNPKNMDPVHYINTIDMLAEISEFSNFLFTYLEAMIPLGFYNMHYTRLMKFHHLIMVVVVEFHYQSIFPLTL